MPGLVVLYVRVYSYYLFIIMFVGENLRIFT